MQFQRDDLECTHYHWSDKEQHIFTGQPSRRSFDRYNGDQVLFLINYYSSISNDFTLDEAKKIERRLFNELPLEAKSEITVISWIENTIASPKENHN